MLGRIGKATSLGLFMLYNCNGKVYLGFQYRVFNIMGSVKLFKSKNRDKIDLDAPNPNLKKGYES